MGDKGKAVPLTEDKFLVVVSLIVDGEVGFVELVVIFKVLKKFVDESRKVLTILVVLFPTSKFVALKDIL